MTTDSSPNTTVSKRDVFTWLRTPYVLAAVVLLVCLLIAGVVFLAPAHERINKDGYQVVYMASGQAYFGQLRNTSGEYLMMENPYTAQDIAPDKEEAASDDDSTTLLKISEQQYGPENVISLKSDQVTFWQNLRSNSKVSQAIEDSLE